MITLRQSKQRNSNLNILNILKQTRTWNYYVSLINESVPIWERRKLITYNPIYVRIYTLLVIFYLLPSVEVTVQVYFECERNSVPFWFFVTLIEILIYLPILQSCLSILSFLISWISATFRNTTDIFFFFSIFWQHLDNDESEWFIIYVKRFFPQRKSFWKMFEAISCFHG